MNMENIMNSWIAYYLSIIVVFTSTASWANHNSKESLLIGVESVNNPPFHWITKDGEYIGFVRDLMDLFATEIGTDFKYVGMPIKRLFEGLVQSDIDIKVPDNPLWQPSIKQNTGIQYSAPFLEVHGVVVGFVSASEPSIGKISHISIPLGYTLSHLDNDQIKDLTIIKTSSVISCINMALSKRTQGCFAGFRAIKYYLQQQFPNQLKNMRVYSDMPPQIGEFRISTSHHVDIINKFDQFLINQEKKILLLKKKHGL